MYWETLNQVGQIQSFYRASSMEIANSYMSIIIFSWLEETL
jgi:hypothetical protein